MCTCGKTWVGHTHRSIRTMRMVYIAAELQYSRTSTAVHVMMAPRDSDTCTIPVCG